MATILVEILAKSDQFKSQLDGVVASTEKANSGFSKMAKGAGVVGAALAGGLAVGLVKSVEAADEMQQSTARMNAAFAASHVSVTAFAEKIDQAETSSRKLGFSNDQVRGSLGSLVIATHSGNKSMADLAVAEDIARFKHISLEAATKVLTTAMAGSQRATKQLGIDVPKVTTAQDAMRASGIKLKEQIIQQHEVVAKLTAEHDKSADGVKRLKDAQATLSVEEERAKQVTLSHSSAVYQQELAHAKLVDRLATENAVIATVTEKLHGQADAYSKTAAGGMAQFHAQLGDLEEKLGTLLLPALTSVATALATVSTYFSANLPLTKELIAGIGALAVVLLTVSAATKIYAAGQTLVAAATKVWAAAQWLLNAALDANPIGIVVIAIAALATGLVLAYQRSATFRAIVTGALNAVTTAANTVLGFFRSNWPLIAVLISGPFAPLVLLATNAFGVRSALIGAIEGIKSGVSSGISVVVGFFSALPGRITGALGDVSSLLYDAGVGIIQGLYDGMVSKVQDVYNLAGSIAGKIKSLKGPLDKDAVLLIDEGQAIIASLQAGMESGIPRLNAMTSKIAGDVKTATQAAVNGASAVLQAARSTFQSAWSQLASGADSAFQKLHAGIQTTTEALIANNSAMAAAAQLAGNLASAQAQLADAQAGTPQTDAERALAALTSAHDAAGRTGALSTAQAGLATAQAGGDPAAILTAQQQVADAQYNIQVASLNQQIATEASAAAQKKAISDASAAVDAANNAITDAAKQKSLDDQAAAERLQLDAQTTLQQTHFDAALTRLQAHLASGHETYKQANAAILKLFKTFGVQYAGAGAELGTAFVQGLGESITNAAKGSGNITGKTTGIGAAIVAGAGGRVPHLDTGGVISQTGLAVVHAGETITPAGAGGGQTFIFNGDVWDRNALMEDFRNMLIRTGRNTTGGVLGGF